jgi:arsenite methyltransferase
LTQQELSFYIQQANRIQSVESMIQEQIDSSVIDQYYRESGFLYRHFHSQAGAMHLPIKISNEERHQDKLLFQAKSVAHLINEFGYGSVLELGCGAGFNSIYLATEFPHVTFIAVDITEANLQVGRKLARHLPNLTFRTFNFDEEEYEHTVDVVFGVETFCYSTNLTKLFKHIHKYLNPDGRAVVFDGYVNPSSIRPELNDLEKKANIMLCWGFALTRFQELEEARKAFEENLFDIELEYNYSQHVLPNYKRFQRGAQRFLRYPVIIKLLNSMRILPKALFKQALSGLFGAYLIECNYMGYYHMVAKKRTSRSD